jgi:hypothetical protein
MHSIPKEWQRVAANIGCALCVVYRVQLKCGLNRRDAYRYARTYADKNRLLGYGKFAYCITNFGSVRA